MGHILIIEDDPSIRKLVQVNLTKRGYTVSQAEDSHQAIALFQQVPVDLVLLDLVLPGPFRRGCVQVDSFALRCAHYYI